MVVVRFPFFRQLCYIFRVEVKGASSGGAAAETKELGHHHPKLCLLGVPCWFLGRFFRGQLWRFGPCGVETVTWLSRESEVGQVPPERW